MHASLLLASLLASLPALSHARPQPSPVHATSSYTNTTLFTPCLPSAVAAALVTSFSSLLTNYTPSVATAILAPNFTDTSDSINSLSGQPLNSTTFASRAAFMAAQSAQPPIGFTVINIDAVTCQGVVAFRWVAYPYQGTTGLPVKGINVFEAGYKNLTKVDRQWGHGDCGCVAGGNVTDPANWWIEKNYSEFNSIAWLLDVGGKVVPPT